MSGPLFRYFVRDHARLEGLLRKSVEKPGEVDRATFDLFRQGLLTHLAVEEKVLMKAARAANGGKPVGADVRLGLEHAAIAALLVVTPNRERVAQLREILDSHHHFEEDPGGLYDQCQRLLDGKTDELLELALKYPQPRAAAYRDTPAALRHVEVSLAALHRPA